jgi:biopolymer transport protein ExbD
MAFGSFENSGSSQPMAEINTTPLVDVMLVLLVIFIITAPLFHEALPIDLPRVDASRLDDPPQVLSVAIDAAGDVFIDGQAVERSEMAARFWPSTPVAGSPSYICAPTVERATSASPRCLPTRSVPVW